MPEPDPTDQRLDELYRGAPKEFVAGRNALVKQLRAEGDRDTAGRVGKLRRPSAAAWMLNLVALESPAELREYAEATAELERAQNRAVEGDEGAAAEWRAAAGREREAIAAVTARAEHLAVEAGETANPRVLDLLGATLRAATGDPELRERILRGRLDRERPAATLGTSDAVPAPRPSPRARKRRDQVRARRELEGIEEQLADAAEREERLRGRVEETAEALRREKAKLAEAKRERTALERRVKAARRSAGD